MVCSVESSNVGRQVIPVPKSIRVTPRLRYVRCGKKRLYPRNLRAAAGENRPVQTRKWGSCEKPLAGRDRRLFQTGMSGRRRGEFFISRPSRFEKILTLPWEVCMVKSVGCRQPFSELDLVEWRATMLGPPGVEL